MADGYRYEYVNCGGWLYPSGNGSSFNVKVSDGARKRAPMRQSLRVPKLVPVADTLI